MSPPIVLSFIQARVLLAAQKAGQTQCQVSLDLGRTESEAILSMDSVAFESGVHVSWMSVHEISESENTCFSISDGAIHAIQAFSETTNRFCGLYPTRGAPSILIAGRPMHRIKDTDPYQDTLQKIRAVSPLRGRILDTSTGLGYTAIEAARSADEVITIEIDPTVLEIARQNPWSQALFANPRIKQVLGDSYDEVQGFSDAEFSAIIHDPPMFSLAGDLYSLAFYRSLYRVLRPRGRLFHYIGDPESKSGHGVTKGVVRRLLDAGFERVRPSPEAFGVVAQK